MLLIQVSQNVVQLLGRIGKQVWLIWRLSRRTTMLWVGRWAVIFETQSLPWLSGPVAKKIDQITNTFDSEQERVNCGDYRLVQPSINTLVQLGEFCRKGHNLVKALKKLSLNVWTLLTHSLQLQQVRKNQQLIYYFGCKLTCLFRFNRFD